MENIKELNQEQIKKTLNNTEIAISKLVDECNVLLRKEDYKGYAEKLVELKEQEKKYAQLSEVEFYNDCKNAPNPIITAIEIFDYQIVRHKEEKDKNTELVVKIDTVVMRKPIDLLKFCKHAKLNTDWQYDLEKFNMLYALRVSKELGVEPKELKAMSKCYYMSKKAQDIKDGKTPTSNTQVCKHLQSIIDQILPNDGEDGKPIYKVTNYDLKYLDAIFAKEGKEVLGVALSNHNNFRKIVTKMLYRIVTDNTYSVEYKAKKA